MLFASPLIAPEQGENVAPVRGGNIGRYLHISAKKVERKCSDLSILFQVCVLRSCPAFIELKPIVQAFQARWYSNGHPFRRESIF